ncbi:phage tail protein [Trinickia terrae]|uniref:Phage tail protein n=1 Tax=Trinickia terrae TaxID=2571161 RepID=A0A4U1IC85_9BURK|nr:tail fiber protein [Trinickia terrae]TKC91198.1 phage tail protein [Trinickia terrae]
MSEPFLGEIRMVGFTFAPYGWALAQGQLISVSQNQALFALFGTTYGGDGRATFGLPDLRGRSPVGTGTGPGLAAIEPGEVGGVEAVQLTNTQLPTHTHAVTTTGGGSGTISVAIPATTATTGEGAVPGPTTVLGPASASGRASDMYSTAAPTTTLKPFNVPFTTTAPTVQIGTAGLGQPFETRNPFLGLTCIVALQGIYPSRG